MGSTISRERICCFVKNHPTIQHMKDPKPRLQPQNESDNVDSTKDDHICNDALCVPEEEKRKKIEDNENITQLNHNLSPAKKSVLTEKEHDLLPAKKSAITEEEEKVRTNISTKDNNETKDKKKEVSDLSKKRSGTKIIEALSKNTDAIKQVVGRRSRQIDSNDGISKESNIASLENKGSKSNVPIASKSKETNNSRTTFSEQLKTKCKKATLFGKENFKFEKSEGAVKSNPKFKEESKENIELKKCVMVTIYAGKNLVAKDRNIIGIRGKSDPFVEIHYGDQRVGKTSVIPKTLDPTWGGSLGEKFNFEMKEESLSSIFDEIYVKCIIFDDDKLSSSDPMGTVLLSVPKKLNEERVIWYKVTQGKRPHYCRNARGELKVGIEVRERESDFFSQADKGKKKSKPKKNTLPWKKSKKKKSKESVKDEQNRS